MRLPNQPKPCNGCPFRKQCLPLVTLAEKIVSIVENGVHTCHNTQGLAPSKQRQCAGHMLLKGDTNHFVELANRLGLTIKLSGRELVFDTPEQMIRHHSSISPMP